jgi:hypothetical protein
MIAHAHAVAIDGEDSRDAQVHRARNGRGGCQMGSLRVEVTAEDIAEGRPHLCRQCPVARALRRAASLLFPGLTGAFAGWTYLMAWQDDRTLFQVDTPWSARFFMAYFDNGEPVAPFAFDLDVPEGVPA